MNRNAFLALFHKEILVEWQQKFALSGVLLFSFGAVYVMAIGYHRQLPADVWNVSFWVIQLFIAINAVSKSFTNESDGQRLYIYQLAAPVTVLLAKLAYNILLLVLNGWLSLGFFGVMLGIPLIQKEAFWGLLTVGTASLASALTLISALAAGAGNKPSLMAVLSFPVVLPLLLGLIRQTERIALGAYLWSDLIYIAAIFGITVTLSVLLFPYLWRA